MKKHINFSIFSTLLTPILPNLFISSSINFNKEQEEEKWKQK